MKPIQTTQNNQKCLKSRLFQSLEAQGDEVVAAEQAGNNVMLQFVWQTGQLLQTENSPGGEARRVLRVNRPVAGQVY